MVLRSPWESFEVSEVIADSHLGSLRSLSSVLTSEMTSLCFADRNVSTPRKATKMQEHSRVLASQLASDARVGFGTARPAHFRERQVMLRRGLSSSQSSPNGVGKKVLDRATSTASNSGPTFLATLCTNCHYCCKDFCKPEQAACGKFGAADARSATSSSQNLVFFRIQS